MPRHSLDDAAIQRALEMRAAGRSCKTIAKTLGVSIGAVNYQCLRHGVISPHQRRTAVPIQPAAIVGPSGRVQRAFTQADDEQLMALEAAGTGYRAMARQLGRAYSSIRMRLLAIAIREELPA
ncbi:hypothetical protein [Sphingomonas parapaucimobilis]|uniref:Transposase IS30-like HTH domain-containing protein n=1 Tax=Sphingomonas parapaucimobilis NBRC 15100 TaxID=1219049 RepID=A0A0A1W5P9_9SPHN|nr:hypothetical protein [Sphingomonas parapaucimobilis]GAM00740.1 hypothetical protein SP5_035_01420 [Sphingomonas parapaucimobilis NBRC 15100]